MSIVRTSIVPLRAAARQGLMQQRLFAANIPRQYPIAAFSTCKPQLLEQQQHGYQPPGSGYPPPGGGKLKQKAKDIGHKANFKAGNVLLKGVIGAEKVRDATRSTLDTLQGKPTKKSNEEDPSKKVK